MFGTKIQEISRDQITQRVLRGGLAGLLGGSVFGVWMAEQGMFPVIASMVGSSSSSLGLAMHLAISLGIGASFGVLFARLAEGAVPSLLWGLVYGFVWWVLGPLTFMSVFMGMGLQWSAASVAGAIPSLIWHLVFGGVTGLAYAGLRPEQLPGSALAR